MALRNLLFVLFFLMSAFSSMRSEEQPLYLERIWKQVFPVYGMTDAEFSSDGKFIYTAINDSGKVSDEGLSYLCKLDAATGEILRIYDHPRAEKIYDIDLFKDGRRLITGGEDRKLTVWDTETGEVLKEISAKNFIQYAALTYDDKYVIYYDVPLKLWIYNLETDEKTAIADGRGWVAASDADYTFVYHNWQEQKPYGMINVARYNPQTKKAEILYSYYPHGNDEDADISGLAFSKDNRRVISYGGNDKRFNVQDIVEQKSIYSLKVNTSIPTSRADINYNGSEWLMSAGPRQFRYQEKYDLLTPITYDLEGSGFFLSSLVRYSPDGGTFLASNHGILSLFRLPVSESSVESKADDFIIASPNPSGDMIDLRVSGRATGLTEISLTDMKGENVLLFSGNHNLPDFRQTFDISLLSAGAYILQARIDGTIHTLNITKKK